MTGTAYQTLRARRPFRYRGIQIEAGARVTMPLSEASELKRRRWLDHPLTVRCRLHAQDGSGKEYFFKADGTICARDAEMEHP